MSLNNSVPQPLNKTGSQLSPVRPDYAGLVRFLVQPFLDLPDSLSVDCEISAKTNRAWIRVAFESEDKGRVFGRGGRNIEAIRTVIAAAATAAGHSVYLDIYGSQVQAENMSVLEEDGRVAPTKPRERRPTDPKLVAKPRSDSSSN